MKVLVSLQFFVFQHFLVLLYFIVGPVCAGDNTITNSSPLVLELRESIKLGPPGKNVSITNVTMKKGAVAGVAEKLVLAQDPLFISPLLESNLPMVVVDDVDDQNFVAVQKAVTEIYFALKNDFIKKKREETKMLEDGFRSKIQEVENDLNAKILTVETNSLTKIHALTELQTAQRKEDMQTFSENLNQIQKAHQIYVETQRAEIQQMKSTVETASKGQSNLSTKMSQLQKSVHNLDSKLSELVKKHPEDIISIQEVHKTLEMYIDEIEKEVKTSAAEIEEMQSIVSKLEKASVEDNNKLRKAMIRDQKKDPVQNCIRFLRNKNVGAAVKQWRVIEQITDDLKEALPEDMVKIIDESFDRHGASVVTIAEFIHKTVANGDRRLKEAAYGHLLLEMGTPRHLSESKKLSEMFRLAQYMKSDLGSTYNTSSSTAEIVSRLPDAIRLITFEKVRLSLPSRGYLKVGIDRKVTLVPEEGKFYDTDEIYWHFEYDKEKSDGTFYIKSDKLHKYLLTIQEGYNSYGFKKQILFMTGNKRENGTRFEVSDVSGEGNVLLRSTYWNGYLTWKSSIQTIYGDDDSYFVLLEDKKNGPSAYWLVEAENDF